ncbi:MAG: acyl-CoA thioesterase [Nitrospirae bacterium]|nr:acyl-CoA thioesterase [Candidatus Manganitrophaceae bacterium]
MAEEGKTVAETATEMVQIILPNDTNMLGNLLGGTLMHWIDMVGAIVANRHSRRPIVTASMEGLDFLVPVRLGFLVILKAQMNYAGKSSMEVGVEVYSENGLSGERVHTSSAILTYVAVDLKGRPVPVPKLILTTEEERRRHEEALERKQRRLERLNKSRT